MSSNHHANSISIFKFNHNFWSLIVALFLISCASPQPEQQWTGTWATSPQLVEPHNMPPEPGLTNNTLRQIVRVSIGGDSLRVKFSNEFSNSPVTLKEVRIAVSQGASAIDSTTNQQLTFNQSIEATMEAGSTLTSDPIAFDLKSRMDLAITIYFGQTATDVTGHPGSRTTSFIAEENFAAASELPQAIETEHWYVINGIDVKTAPTAGAIAILGNSITDGRGSGTNQQNRWPDMLSERLVNNPTTQEVAVLNHGIGGNCVLRPCLGPAAIDRFERDVLNQQGVKWLIMLIGVNDLGQTPDSTVAHQVADQLIDAYTQMIDQAHTKGIKVYGATILPIGESFYYAPFREPARQKINDWIRNSGSFDAIIDFDLVMRHPDNPEILQPELHTGDFLHPNELGYKIMGDYIDLSLFE
jgi:lysophospholipase L1-like esterase